jgi:ketosteroid isomerase-like protein
MTAADAQRFARTWLAAWNAHDIESVLDHFSEDVTFTSPVAARIVEGSDGEIRGKDALRDYWNRGIEHYPNLHFEPVGVYLGVHTIVINYRNQNGALVNETLRLEGGTHVVEGHGTYILDFPTDPKRSAGRRR